MSEGRECPCGRPVTDGYACSSCLGLLDRDLALIAWWWPDSEDTLTRRDIVTRTPGRIARSQSTGTPVAWHAVEVRDTVTDTLTAWIRDLTPDVPSSVPGACVWLRANLEAVQRIPDAAQLLDEVGHARHLLGRLVDAAPSPTYVGAHSCGADVWAYGTTPYLTCSCGAVLDIEQMRIDAALAARDTYATASEITQAARMFHVRVTKQQISRWYKSGRLLPLHRDVAPMRWRVGDVIDLARAETA